MGEPILKDDTMIDRMVRFAQLIAPAKFLPEHLRNDVPSIVYALATAHELGVASTHMLRSTFPNREGGLSMKGDVILALLVGNGFKVDFEFGETPIGCMCTITRPDKASAPVSRIFTMDDAQLIETRWLPEQERWERLAENYYYRNFPKAMCQWRSLVVCGRVAAPDVMGGIFLPEEIQENNGAGPKTAPKQAAPPEAPSSTEEFVVGEKPSEPPLAPEAAAPEPTPEPVTVAAPAIDPTPEPPEVVPVQPVQVPKLEPTPPAPAPAEPSFDNLIDQVVKRLSMKVDPAKRLIARYFGAYLDVRYLPTDRAKLMPALKTLAAVIDARVDDLRVEPEKLGRILSGRGKTPLEEEMDALNWTAPVQALAKQVMEANAFTPAAFTSWIHFPMDTNMPNGSGYSIANMPSAALEIFFPLFLLAKNRAYEVIDYALVNNRDVTQTFNEMITAAGRPIAKFDHKFAIAVLDAIKKATAEEPGQPEDQKPPEDEDILPFG